MAILGEGVGMGSVLFVVGRLGFGSSICSARAVVDFYVDVYTRTRDLVWLDLQFLIVKDCLFNIGDTDTKLHLTESFHIDLKTQIG